MTAETTPPIPSRVATAGAGASWWAEGWRMFTSRIGAWAAIMAVFVVIALLLNEVPNIGAIAEWLLIPVLLGGIMLGCDAARRGQPLRLSHLFDGFRSPHFVPLLRVALWNLAFGCIGVVVAVIVTAAGIGASGVTDITNYADNPLRMWEMLGLTYLLLILLGLVFVGVLAMANWFAPALIVLRGATALAAMQTSLRAMLRNWLPFLVYGLVGIAILLAAGVAFTVLAGMIGYEAFVAILEGHGGVGTFTLATGLVFALFAVLATILAAVTFGSTYASYRDIFAAEESPAPTQP
jgi:uncharacterized membrane protein